MNLANKKFVSAFFFFAIVFTSTSILKAHQSIEYCDAISIAKDVPKMSIIPVEGVNQAIVNLYSETANANIIIFNSVGIVVFEENFDVDEMAENSLTLDLSNLKSGTYYIVHDENKDSATYSVN